jgi:HD-like signal output (HDOD) protein
LSTQVEGCTGLAETAFTAGMLHDLGKLLLAANAPDAYRLILAEAAESHQPIWQVEQEDLGFTHAELGACMLGIWGIALPVVDAVAWHHRPGGSANSQASPVMLVHLADCKVRNLPPDPAHARLAGLS